MLRAEQGQRLAGVGVGLLRDDPALCVKDAHRVLAVAEINSDGCSRWFCFHGSVRLTYRVKHDPRCLLIYSCSAYFGHLCSLWCLAEYAIHNEKSC